MTTDAEIQELRKRNPFVIFHPYSGFNKKIGYERACDELEKMQASQMQKEMKE